MGLIDGLIRAARKFRRRDPRLEMLHRCAEGEVPVPIALMRLAYQSRDAEEMAKLIAAALGAATPGSAAHARLAKLGELRRSHPKTHDIVRRMDVGAPRGQGVAEADYWAAEFDRAVEVSPEASVALYSFGDPVLLQRMTDEIVDKLVQWDVLHAGSRVLDYGCGIGRVTARLASHAAEIVGVDVSAGMLRTAAARLSEAGNVRLADARAFAADDAGAPFDLILLVDVLPYVSDPMLLLGSLAKRLTPGASLVVMNWSYDRSLEEQRAQAREFAGESGLAVLRNGTAEFDLWDGAVFHFLNRATGNRRGQAG
jgi:2-polyprenyl-3-methyl-5-hydroxy-6-metoxy-1,4-benzoquinol methylase